MTSKIITGVAVCAFLAAITLFGAEKAQAKKPAAKPRQQAEAVEVQPAPDEVVGPKQQHEGLLDQLIVAYKANDREKMGEIINKMEARRDKMQKLAKLNKWHQQSHRRMAAQAGPRGGWGRGGQMAGPRWEHGWAAGGPNFNRGWVMGGNGARWGGQPYRQGGMAGCGAMNGRPGQMRGWDRQPGQFAPMRQWRQGPGADMPRPWNMPGGGERREKIPPADWGW